VQLMILDVSVSGCPRPQLHIELHPQTCRRLADADAYQHLWSFITPYTCNTTQS